MTGGEQHDQSFGGCEYYLNMLGLGLRIDLPLDTVIIETSPSKRRSFNRELVIENFCTTPTRKLPASYDLLSASVSRSTYHDCCSSYRFVGKVQVLITFLQDKAGELHPFLSFGAPSCNMMRCLR